MSPFPAHVSIVSRVDHVLSKETWTQTRKSLLLFLLCRICGMQRRGRVDKGATQEATTPRQTAAPEAGPVLKGIILYAIRTLKINGVEINRSVFRHTQTASRCRTRRVHSSIHTAASTRCVPFTSTENTSRCGLSVPDEPDVVEAVCTWKTRWVPFAKGTRVE